MFDNVCHWPYLSWPSAPYPTQTTDVPPPVELACERARNVQAPAYDAGIVEYSSSLPPRIFFILNRSRRVEIRLGLTTS